ncbi:MAG: hypothetical protein WBA31_00945 [Candidatus Dormiibacterota bacterium]
MRVPQRLPRRSAWLGGTVLALLLGSGLLAGCGAGPALGSQPQSAQLVTLAADSAWKQAAAPTSSNDAPAAISCADASHCWAVGVRYQGSNKLSLIEAYSGTRWAVESSPSIADSVSGYDQDSLSGIACPSTTDCWAVGEYFDGGDIPLLEHYNGADWTTVAGPSGGSLLFWQASLSAVTCVSSSDCWAVGTGADLPLVEQFNGSTWSIVPSQQAGNTSQEDTLDAVSCSSADSCWAVGDQDYNDVSSQVTGQPLIESSSGGSWTVVPSPSLRTQTQNQLAALSCPSAATCWAVGGLGQLYRHQHTIDPAQPLMEKLSQGSWRLVPEKGPSGAFLSGVSCPTQKSCWIVGQSGTKGLVESWSGSRWVLAKGVAKLLLSRVSCLGGGGCWALGEKSEKAKASSYITTFFHN